MKLLISTDSFLPRWDGIARFLHDLIPHLAQDYEISVIAPKFPGVSPSFNNVHIHRLPLIKKAVADIHFSWPSFAKVSSLVKEADIIFNQTIGPIGLSTIRAARKHNKPVVSFVHSIEWELTSKSVGRAKKFIYHGTKQYAKYLYNKCTRLIVPTEEVRHILYGAGIRTKKSVAHLGVNIAKFMPAIDRKRAKENLQIDPNMIVIGYCGRIAREKDLPTLRKAFRSIRRRNPNIMLLIVGQGPKEQMDALQAEGIVLAGAQNNVIPFLQAMDIYVLPSLTETTSLSTMEAMASGLAVVATPVGYVKEYIKKEKNGLLFARHSADALKKHLERLIKDEELRSYLGRNARKAMIAKHRWHFTVKAIKETLSEVRAER